MSRWGILGTVVVGVVGAFGYAGGWLTPHRLTPAHFIDTFERVNGAPPPAGFRRNHAKGVCATGFFDGNGKGVAISRASVFESRRVPVVGRFALAGGHPLVADSAETVRSMAILFSLPNGEEWRSGMNDIPVFPAAGPEGFYDQLVASAPDPKTGKPDSAKMAAFLAKHPESARAIDRIQHRTASAGFEDDTYNGLNAFRFVNASGASVPVRWAMVPMQASEVSGADPPPESKNHLFDALIARVHHGPLHWRLVATIGQPGDPTNDATIAWPDGRATVELGTLTIDRIESEDEGACRDVNYDPLVLPAGIEPSDDPLLSARSAAYSESFTRRAGETKAPSAVTPEEARR
jgi:catalase